MYRYEEEVWGQTERLSARLSDLTCWGSYGGDIVNRYHFTALLKEFPNVVRVESSHYGQSLVLALDGGIDSVQLREVIRFLAYFDSEADGYGDYPIYWEDEFYMFEEGLAWEEISTGWWGENALDELRNWIGDWDNTLVPPTQAELANLLYEYNQADDWSNWEIEWESADSLLVHGYDTEKFAMWLLEGYARYLTEAGNPDPLVVV